MSTSPKCPGCLERFRRGEDAVIDADRNAWHMHCAAEMLADTAAEMSFHDLDVRAEKIERARSVDMRLVRRHRDPVERVRAFVAIVGTSR